MNRTFACALLALSFAACSSSNSGSGGSNASDGGAATDSSTSTGSDGSTGTASTSALDGTWKFTTPSQILGADVNGGSMVAANGMYALTFIGSDVGQSTGEESADGGTVDCTIAKEQTVVAVQITKAALTGTVTQQSQTTGTQCGSTTENDIVLYDISGTQTTVATPTLTPYDGVWTVTLTDQTGEGQSISFTVTIAGGTWTSSAPLPASGTVANGMATATSMGDTSTDFAAQKQ